MFFLAAGDMPIEARELRIRLQIEYQRLLDWSKVAGLLEYEYGQELPDVLRADKLVLVAILSQIQALMEEFATLNGRYKQLKPDEQAQAQAEQINLTAGFASISLEYEKHATKRKHVRGTNHLLAMAKNVKDVATDPKRLWWVAFDADVFKELLRKLSEYNNYLYELMRGQHARKLEETTRNTYLEMIQVRSSIDELKSLVAAAILLGEHSDGLPSSNTGQSRNDQILHSMAKFKGLCLANEASTDDKPPAYYEVVSKQKMAYASIDYDHKAADPKTKTGRIRVDGTFTHDKVKTAIFIEWKTYKVRFIDDDDIRKRAPLEENVTRVKELTGLLKHSNLAEFRVPRCIGYFDDRDDKPESENPDRFGIVFERPGPTPNAPGPVSLLDALAEPCPSLSVRVVFAHKIAKSLLYLHAVKWLHKGLRSDGVIFSRDPKTGNIDFSEPLLSGFEYARPDRDGVQSTSISQDPLAELYVHPDYQGDNAVGSFQKTFDVYSLGVVLLEIAYWQPIQKIMAIADPERPKPSELSDIRGRILERNSLFLQKVRAHTGDRFHEALASCVEGPKAFGLGENDDDAELVPGATLQREFTKKVVENLGEISL